VIEEFETWPPKHRDIFLERLEILLNELAHQAPTRIPLTQVDFPAYKDTSDGQATARGPKKDKPKSTK
jgi:hypothetical protein